MPDVIDLRSKKEEMRPARDLQKSDMIEWSALEYEARERTQGWYIFMGGAATLLVILGILAGSYFFIAFVLLAFVVMVMYAKRSPRRMDFSITSEGIRAGTKFYRMSDLKSFWIFNSPNAKELSLEVKSGFMPFLRFPLGDTNPEEVKRVLLNFIPEEEHKELMTDQIARGLGF